MPTRQVLAALSTSCLILVACGPAGSGNLITEERDVGSFESVNVSGGIDLHLTVDPSATTEVTVSFDDNLIDQVRTEVVNGVLIIAEETGSFFWFGGDALVSVSVADLESLTASGGSDVTGSGELTNLELKASGGCDVDLDGLPIESIVIDASGGSDVVVRPLVSVVGKVSGGADVTVRGSPNTIDVETTGGADLHTP